MTLQTVGLAYSRGPRLLFSGIDLTVQPGQSLRVAGRNGSGKTSLLRLLCGLAEPDAGEVRWQGKEISGAGATFHEDLLYVGHGHGVKDELTALENVRIAAALWGRHCTSVQAQAALARLGLADRAVMLAKALSQGQRRRLALARLALLPAPRLVVLDEPFNALDAESTAVLRSLLDELLARGAVLVYTTHQGQEVGQSQLLDLDQTPRSNGPH
jgi:heme exporter protein A